MNKQLPAFGLLLTSLFSMSGQSIELTSADIQDNKPMGKQQEFAGFGCSGQNQSPQLSWSQVPAGTKSLAITAYDPDAPTGSGWWHWLVYNLPATSSELKAGAGSASLDLLPQGASHGRNDFGQYQFGGACPPPGHGVHHYEFTVHALDVDKLEVPKDASAALIGYMLNQHSKGKATITALYER